MKLVLLAASLLAATAAVAAGPYDEPYSIITVDRAKSADPLLRRVIVNRVDDVTVMSDNKAVVPPGRHKVTLDLPPRKGFNLRSEEHTSELQSRFDLVCRLLLEKKKTK